MDKSVTNLAALQAINAQDPAGQVFEQHFRAGSSGDQTPNQAHDGFQGFPVCPHHPVRH
jgi:hypothetical protein